MISTAPAAEQKKRPSTLIYALDESPPPARLALLGIQYAVMSAIYLILVAIILRRAHVTPSVSVGLMGVAGVGLAIGTALQGLPRGPIGSGFLAPPVFSAIFLAPSVLAAQTGGMPLVFGMTLFAGVVEFITGFVLKRLRLVITPVLSGLTVFIVGLELGMVGIGETLDVQNEGLPAFPLHVAVATLTLLVPMALSIWGRGALKLVCSLLGLIVGIVGAFSIGLIGPAQLATLADTAWIALPRPAIFHLEFDSGLYPLSLRPELRLRCGR